MSPDRRTEIERWFQRRGVPQLVHEYASERRMDTRAAPLIAAWLVIGIVLFWGTDPAWPPLVNAAAAIGTIAFVALGFAGARVLRGRQPASRQERIDLVDVLLLGLLPAIPAALIAGSWWELLIAGPNALLGIGVIYIVIGFGLVELGAWAIGRLWSELAEVIGLLARTLPVLLILVVFLLFAAELWEAAHALQPVELAAVVVLLAAIAITLIVTTVRSEVRRLEEPWEADDLLVDAAGSPATSLATNLPPRVEPPPLHWLERLNLVALGLVSQLIRSTFVAMLVFAVLIAFGLIALPASVQSSWIGAPATSVLSIDLLGERRDVTAELLTVSAVLSAIVGLYFTGLALTDSAYREQHFNRVVTEVRRVLAVRTLYRRALAAEAVVPEAADLP